MPSNFAGSAIAQGPNVGRIDRWSQWKPTTVEPLWLLLSGASNPPEHVNVSDRRSRDEPGVSGGTFLPGVIRDLTNVEAEVETRLFNVVRDFYLTKSYAFRHIKRLFDACKGEKAQPMLYYTGHGEVGTGNWCFADGTISIQEIFDAVPKGVYYPMIFSDACFSGHWANFCLVKNIAGFHCLAACPEFSTALDTRGKGGDLTLFMTGKKSRPSTEPIYSGGNISDYPITSKYDSVEYTDLISSHICNSENILVCQSLCNGCFYGCFAPSKRYNPRPALSWAMRSNYDTFLELVKENWNWKNGKSKQIYSLACDEDKGFGVFFMENYGTRQWIITNTSDIQEKWNEGFQITACAARGSTFYIIMTKDTEEYKDKPQSWCTRSTWAETCAEMDVRTKEGKVITGLCYSSGLKQYLAVMTKFPVGHCSQWFDQNGTDYIDWMDEKWKEGYHPTITFRDPNFKKTLIVMTTDENRSGYSTRFAWKIK